jgi:hypothetical protein
MQLCGAFATSYCVALRRDRQLLVTTLHCSLPISFAFFSFSTTDYHHLLFPSLSAVCWGSLPVCLRYPSLATARTHSPLLSSIVLIHHSLSCSVHSPLFSIILTSHHSSLLFTSLDHFHNSPPPPQKNTRAGCTRIRPQRGGVHPHPTDRHAPPHSNHQC